MEKPKVFFSRDLSPDTVLKLYSCLNTGLDGRIAAKLHSGEKGNQNYLGPDFWRPVIDSLGATVVECNTAYEGARNNTERHKKLMDEHGWDSYFRVEIMDADGETEADIPNGKVLKKNILGAGIEKYDSMIVLSHFKGHPMGGYGGALKQLSIGCASTRGKCLIHSAGRTDDQNIIWDNTAPQYEFLEAMADAASSVVKMFENRLVYINAICNLSVDCDCCSVAEDPCMKDIGIVASTDPVAIDQACIDLVMKQTDDPGLPHFMERIESRHGIHTIEAAAELGIGSREYELTEI